MGNIEKFDSIAGQYDTAERIETANLIVSTLRKYIRDGKDKAALDYGCGTGLVGLQLLEDFAAVLLVDASANMVSEVERKITELGAKNASALCCDLMSDRLPDIHADYIIVVMVLLHEKDTKSLLARLASVLNPGGHLIIVDFDKNKKVDSELVHHGFDQRELAGILHELSLENVNSEIFHHGEHIFMNQDASLFIIEAEKN